MAKKNDQRFTKDYLRKHGEDMELFKGLDNGAWFHRINNFSNGKGIALEH